MHENAVEIAEGLLERTRAAFFNRDFDEYRRCFFLPLEVQTFEGNRWLLTIDDVREVYDNLHHKFADEGITDMARRCIAAAFTGPDTIETTHETRLLFDKLILGEAYPCFSILQRINGVWVVSFTQYAVDGNSSHNEALLGILDDGENEASA